MSTESKNNWRLLHELILKAKEANDFESLGPTMDVMAELIHKARSRLSTGENPPFYNELCAAYDAAQEKMQFWRANPPPITPQETQIGPGNPFPIPPPPPPPTVAASAPQAPGSLDAQDAKAIESAAEAVKTPEPWTGEELYLAVYDELVERPLDFTSQTTFTQKVWNKAACLANERMGIVAK